MGNHKGAVDAPGSVHISTNILLRMTIEEFKSVGRVRSVGVVKANSDSDDEDDLSFYYCVLCSGRVH